MKKSNLYGLSVSALVMIFILSLSGCRTSGVVTVGNPPPAPAPIYDEGQPPWAPAHGNHAKYRYRYYPYHRVYFDEGRRVYFYLSGDTWRMSASLPPSIRISVNEFVTIDMDDDRPYRYHNDVVKRYPTVQGEKINQGPENNKYQDNGKPHNKNLDGNQDKDKKKSRDNESDEKEDGQDSEQGKYKNSPLPR